MTAERIWIATAPAGVVSSGPSVIYGEGYDGLGSTLAQYREMGWEVAGPYVLTSEPPRLIPGRAKVEVNEQRGERMRRQERMERIARDELSKDPPDTKQCDGGCGSMWCSTLMARARFPEPTQAQVAQAEQALAQALTSIARRGDGERNARANWLDARDALRRWEAEGGALPREP